MSYKEWLKWRKEYYRKEKCPNKGSGVKMTKKNWKDLLIGLSMVGLSTWLFINQQYTIEVAILLCLLTLWWLEFF